MDVSKMKKFLHLAMLSSILLGSIANPLGVVYAVESQQIASTTQATKATTTNDIGKINIQYR